MDLRDRAKRRFYCIVNHFEVADSSKSHDSSSSGNQYSRPRLVRLTYEYALSEESQDNFLRAFFQSMALALDGDVDFDLSNEGIEEELGSALFGFAEYLLDNLFLPLKASTKRTPQPSPAYHSAVQKVQGGAKDFAGTPDRVSALRGACLIRDRRRCVISRRFDRAEGIKRLEKEGLDSARDDDGSLLSEETTPFDSLEVAHILPHSLTKLDSSSQLGPSKQAALAILNMFDAGVTHPIEGTDIDRPLNALTLTHTLHQDFSAFRVFFEVTDQPHTYRIDTFLPRIIVQDVLPVTRALHLTDNRLVDPPSPRLLTIHRAIAYILHLSAAGAYIDRILQDIEENGIHADGSTELGRLVNLEMGGWLSNPVGVF